MHFHAIDLCVSIDLHAARFSLTIFVERFESLKAFNNFPDIIIFIIIVVF